MSKTWDLRDRTMDFAVATFRFCRTLPHTDESREIARQLRRAASSVAANCRASKRAQSNAVFAAKTAIVIEEADEAGFWLELLANVELTGRTTVMELSQEASELVAIFTASRKTVMEKMKCQPGRRRSS